MTYDAKAEAGALWADVFAHEGPPAACEVDPIAARLQAAYDVGLREGAEREREACAEIADHEMRDTIAVAAAIRARAKGG